jgi:alkanesulfonate monooxygenase SsuD/methylene tetrahydromethanopterin reductase-like flavin-dependent oxidoreductase (luciferase family)
MAGSADLHFVRRAVGQYGPLASPEEAAAYPYTPIDRQRVAHNRKRLIVGSPAQVKERIDALVAATRADEVMVTTMVFDHAARKHSYELIARAFGLVAKAETTAA